MYKRQVPQLLKYEVENILASYKKPNSAVQGDIPGSLVGNNSTVLSVPLTMIYNTCLARTTWPKRWKVETLVRIPKKMTPTTYNDLRPISMSTLRSKILESFISEFTMQETGPYWKGSQHGGIKGSSTEHILIDTWDRTLRSLERGRNKCVVMKALDFSKSFSKCTHQEILLLTCTAPS